MAGLAKKARNTSGQNVQHVENGHKCQNDQLTAKAKIASRPQNPKKPEWQRCHERPV